MAQKRMYNLALLNTEQDIVHKMDFTDIIDFIHSCKKTGKDCFKCFVLRTCNFGFRFHLFLYQKFFCCHYNEKIIIFFSPIFAIFVFSKIVIYMNTKLTFEVGALNFSGTSNSRTTSSSPFPCSEDHHLPHSDCEFSLIY